MALNTTLAERRTQAANDLADKLKLERRAITELREFFDQMGDDLGAFFSVTGRVPEATAFADDLAGVLSRQYRRTARVFSGQLLDFIRDDPRGAATAIRGDLGVIATGRGVTVDDLVTELSDQSTITRQSFITTSVADDVQLITRTNQKEMAAAAAKAEANLIESLERQPTNREIGVEATKLFKNRGPARSNTIASTVTQKAAEGTKNIEKDTLLAVRNSVEARVQGLTDLEASRIWATVGDDLVRGSHLEADFDEDEGGIFTVQGQSLRFPGDTSLGATASNVIKCRCSAIMVIEN